VIELHWLGHSIVNQFNGATGAPMEGHFLAEAELVVNEMLGLYD
jgi:hypothetical protein